MQRIYSQFFCSRSAPAGVPASLPEAEEDPDGVLALPAAQAGAGIREEPVRRGPGEEGARQVTQLVRNTGKHMA